jgi:hypothetical protein
VEFIAFFMTCLDINVFSIDLFIQLILNKIKSVYQERFIRTEGEKCPCMVMKGHNKLGGGGGGIFNTACD